jgi:hypothetical protein
MLKPLEASFPAFENDGVDILIRNCIYSAIAKGFGEYTKLEFFIYNINLDSIIDRIKFFLECNDDILAEISSEKFESITEFMEEYMKSVVMATCGMDTPKENIIKIMTLTKDSGLIIIPFEDDRYSALISENVVIKPNEFFEIFPYKARV